MCYSLHLPSNVETDVKPLPYDLEVLQVVCLRLYAAGNLAGMTDM